MKENIINTLSYNHIADQWDKIRRMRPVDPIIARFADLLPKGARILDVGCGTGYPISGYLSENGFSVIGIDPAEQMLEKAENLRLENAEFHLCDLFSYETQEKFGAVIAFDSVFHIPMDKQAQIYPKIACLLTPGGLFLFTGGKKAGDVKGQMFDQEFHYGALDAEDVRTRLHAEGFEILEFHEDYKDAVTGTRDLVVIAKKKGLMQA